MIERRGSGSERGEVGVQVPAFPDEIRHRVTEHLFGPSGVQKSLQCLLGRLLAEKTCEVIAPAGQAVLGVAQVVLDWLSQRNPSALGSGLINHLPPRDCRADERIRLRQCRELLGRVHEQINGDGRTQRGVEALQPTGKRLR